MTQQIHIALIGRCRIAGERAEWREPGFLQNMCGLKLRQMCPIWQDMRRQNPCCARFRLHFVDELIRRRAMVVAAGVLLVGQNGFADERLDFCPDFECTLG